MTAMNFLLRSLKCLKLNETEKHCKKMKWEISNNKFKSLLTAVNLKPTQKDVVDYILCEITLNWSSFILQIHVRY